jgi:hypothetical protein
MTEAVDPVTRTLTGDLPFIFLLAAFLTWPIALGLLGLYTRAVRRSMRSLASRKIGETSAQSGEVAAPGAHAGTTSGRATLHDLPLTEPDPEASALLSQLIARPKRAAIVYAVGGLAYALVMGIAQLLADGLEILPVRLAFQIWVSAWPIVLTTSIVASATRFARVALAAAYFVVLFAIAAMAMPGNPDLTWGQVLLSWALNDLPPTLIMLTYLSRRVRAVGPLVLIFMMLALVGSNLAVIAANSDERYLRAIITMTGAVGLGGVGTFWLLLGLGFAVFGVVGWLALTWIRRQYQAKQISDESLTIDAIWTMFAIAHSVNLVFGHPLWALAGIVALAAYKICVRTGLRWAARDDDVANRRPVLLVLRSFSIGKDGERLFDVVDRFWRRVGAIQMIAGVDLARRTVEPHEFLDFISGKLARRFIGGPAELEQRMQERDSEPDRDLRFRVNDFFCYDDTWKMVLTRLARESDAVLMDLRGFTRSNAGCVFELRELARIVPLERVVFVVDRRTDEDLLAETLGEHRAGVYRLTSMKGRHVRRLMQSLAAAAAPMEVTLAR